MAIRFAKAAVDGFFALSPTKQDIADLKEELRRLQERLSRDPEDDLAVRVLFRDYAEAYFTWVGKWRIIYIRQNPDAYVVHIDNEMEQTRG